MFTKILVPLDRSSFAEQALGAAVGVARASGAQLSLMLVHVPRPLAGTPDVEWHARQVAGEEQYLAGIARRISETTGILTSYMVATGDVVSMICKRALIGNADLIVMTSHTRTGLDRAWIGSVTDGVIRKSATPVYIVRPQREGTAGTSLPEILDSVQHNTGAFLRRILVPLDGSSLAHEILPGAAALAQCAGGHLILLRVVEPVPTFTPQMGMSFGFVPPVPSTLTTDDLVRIAEQSLAETAANLADSGCHGVETRVVVAPDVSQAIIHYALEDGVDVIAMSTHGRGVSRLLIGSVADKVLRNSVVPMLLRRPTAKHGGRTDEEEKAEKAHLSTIMVI